MAHTHCEHVDEERSHYTVTCPVQRNEHRDPFSGRRGVDRAAQRKLTIAIVLCAAFTAVEAIGGYVSGSLAIFTDAAHLLADLGGFAVSLLAIRLGAQSATARLSFGYQRAEILGALVSLAFVWATTAGLLWEAYERMRDPQPVEGRVMTLVAAIGVCANLLLGFVLGEHHHHGCSAHSHVGTLEDRESLLEEGQAGNHFAPNINVRAAFVHAVGDLIQSLGVLVTAVVVWIRPEWYAVDPLCTLLSSVLVLFSTFFLARDTVLILMEAVPSEIDPEALRRDLCAVKGVVDAHDLHVWALAPGNITASVHVLVDIEANITTKEAYASVLEDCHTAMCSHSIHHAAVQIEPARIVTAISHCRTACCGSPSLSSLSAETRNTVGVC